MLNGGKQPSCRFNSYKGLVEVVKILGRVTEQREGGGSVLLNWCVGILWV